MTTDQSVSLTPRLNPESFRGSEVAPVDDRLRTVSISTVFPPSAATKSCRAFTFVELLVVLAVLTVMVSLVATALAKGRPNSQGAICLNNMRQLMAAFTMYTHDSSDFFPPNPDTPSSLPGANWVPGVVSGWMPNMNAGGNVDAGNPDLLKDSSRSLLVPYIRTNISLFRCPFDPRICPYAGSDTNLVGQNIPVVRSIAMNQGVGTKGPALASGTAANSPVDGPWLDGNHSHTANNPYATFGKWSDFRLARPSEIWVVADEDPWSINDAAFAVIAAMPDFVNYPSALNDNGTSLSFADGHGETHKWKSTLFIHNGVPPRTTAFPGIQYQDAFWWASHATRSRVTGSVYP
jgi:prepilin-type N-terminal cleavage/methylation domain-containing protein